MFMIDRTAKSLPGAFRRTYFTRKPFVQALTSSSQGAKKTACIIGPDNGMGLSRDRDLISAEFQAAGWMVSYVGHRDHGKAHHAVNIHLETMCPQFLRMAARNIVIPNPEWWSTARNADLADQSVTVWAKTADTDRIFRDLGAKVEHLGFTSADRRSTDAELKTRTFLHIAGASPNKGTAGLISSWRPEWPWLCVVSSKPLGILHHANNVKVIYKRLPDEAIRKLQNEYLFHIYPSEYEGFGHAQWEGLSCGAIVFATGAPPFSEHDAFRQLAATPCGVSTRAGLDISRRHRVTSDAIAEAVSWATALTDEQVADLGAQSRAAWEANEAAFRVRIRRLISDFDEAPRIVVSVPIPPYTYIGRVNCVTGQGAAARHQLHVLRKSGLTFRVIDAGSCASPDPRATDPFVQTARASDPGTAATGGTIIHLQPNTAEKFHRGAYPRPHILVSVWETTTLPREWVPLINGYDQVWCATNWQRDVYLASGVRPELLRVVPFALDPCLYAAKPLNKADRTVFGSVFQWSERKDPAGLIGAYIQAFSSAYPVQLLLKSYEGDSPTAPIAQRVEAIIKQLKPGGDCPQIGVVSSSLDSAGMSAFYGAIDCYVSAHRGEGFGLPIAEALLHGRPVIATDWSAPAEYAAGLYRPVGYELVHPHGMEWQPFYTPDQRWAQADRNELAAAMRDAAAGEIPCNHELVRNRFADLARQAGNAARSALRELLK